MPKSESLEPSNSENTKGEEKIIIEPEMGKQESVSPETVERKDDSELEEARKQIEKVENQEVLEKIFSRVEATNNLEVQLEKRQEPIKPRKKGFLFKVMLGASILFGGTAVYKVGEEISRNNQETVEGYDESAEKQKIIDNTGIDLREISEKYGFETKLEVDNGTGQYIIHLGQTHALGKKHGGGADVMNLTMRDEVIDSQKSIEQIILEIQGKGSSENIIYMEGFAKEDDNSKFSVELNDIKEEIEKRVGLTIKDYSLIAKTLHSYSLKGAMVGGENESQDIAVAYCLSKKVEAMERDFKKNPPKFNAQGDEEKYLEAQKIIQSVRSYGEKNIFSIVNKDNIYMRPGLGTKLILDKNTTIKGAEDKKTSDAAFNAISKGLRVSDRPKEIFDDRENLAVDIISSDAEKYNHRLMLMVYGKAHDFKKSVEAHNKENSSKVGLIKISSIENK